MKLPIRPESEPLEEGPPLPCDVKRAIGFLRAALRRPISMADLVRHCGVPARTLSQHFRSFLDVSPMHYLRRLRLAAAREALLAGAPGISVTEVAKRYEFHHFGRFAGQYRRCFGEPPSETLRRGRAAAASERKAARRGDGRGTGAALPSRERPSLAVLPCQGPAHEPALGWLATGLAESLAAALSSGRGLVVKLPASPRAALGDPRRLAQELGTRYLLTGRITPDGGRLRIVLRLVETATGNHLWGESFDGARDRPLDLEDRIVASAVRAVMPQVRSAEIERARRAPPQNLDAHGLALRALPFVFASRPAAAERALDLLARAIEIDPDHGLPPALAAWCHAQLVMYNGTPAPAEEKARALRLLRRAAILDDEDPIALAARSAVHTMAREFDAAEALVARALARDPSFGWAWGRSGWLRSYRGDSEAAIRHFRRALILDKDAGSRANSRIGIGGAHFNAERYEAAARWLRSGMREQPDSFWANRSLSVSYARLGERQMALDSLDTLRRFCPGLTVGQVVSAVPFRPDFLDRLGDGLSGLGLPP